MEIKSYEELAALTSGLLRRGAAVNSSFPESEYGPAILRGECELLRGEDWLIVLRQRPGHRRMNFILNGLPEISLPEKTVTEIAGRERDEALWRAQEHFESLGFAPILRRQRLTRKSGEISESFDGVTEAPMEMRADVCAFLEDNFSPLTGCLPTVEELSGDMENKNVLLLRDERGIAGLIHTGSITGGYEIRHLAVREDRRGSGLTAPLIGEFLRRTGGRRTTVWLTEGNAAAMGAYARFGFAPDGYRSVVLYK